MTENKLPTFFQHIQSAFQTTTDCICSFSELVTMRKNEIQSHFPNLAHHNLAILFEHPAVLSHIQHTPLAGLSGYWHQLEIAAIEHYGSLLVCWANYERFLIFNRNQGSPFLHYSSLLLPFDESLYQSEIVDNIEKDSRLFLTLHCDCPLPLSDAIALINLDNFIIGQKWYEMLFCLHLSQKGSHFLLYQTDSENQPIILSTVLIQHWHERKNWLSFDSFFQGDHWCPCLPPDAGQYLYQTGIFNTKILQNIDCEYEESFSQYLEHTDAICELLRLTVSGSNTQRFFLLYLSQKQLVQQLVNYGKKVSFTIIEQPILLDLYGSLQKGKSHGYLNRSKCNHTQTTIYKGFWLNESLNESLSQYKYSQYKLLMISRRKKYKEFSVVT